MPLILDSPKSNFWQWVHLIELRCRMTVPVNWRTAAMPADTLRGSIAIAELVTERDGNPSISGNRLSLVRYI